MRAAAKPTSGNAVRVLDEDLKLAAIVHQESFQQARLAAVAPLIAVAKGKWEPPSSPRQRLRDLGLLILDGVPVRESELAGRSFVELRGADDLLRPWDDATEIARSTPGSAGPRSSRPASRGSTAHAQPGERTYSAPGSRSSSSGTWIYASFSCCGI